MTDYEDQLSRALEQTPDFEGGGSRADLPTPEARQEGNVTVYENYRDTVDRLDREPEDLLGFLQSELGTSAQIDERGRARLTGSFDARRLADAIEAYADAFVRCPECGLPDTQLVERAGATMIQCDACGALSPTG
ncbi:MAG: translation initiation factor IF-2 subunit beta [Halobacteriales archaeon]|nr:translation initiation factor IF-2 subunit beta [Halobacteriales archaeon]